MIESSLPMTIESRHAEEEGTPRGEPGTCATVAQAVLRPKPLTRAMNRGRGHALIVVGLGQQDEEAVHVMRQDLRAQETDAWQSP